jgi:hypothetical protein
MSLDSWLKKPTARSPSPILKPKERKILGIIGGHKREDYETFQKTIMNDILVKIGTLPDLILMNDEGKDTSGMIHMWCEKNDIPCHYVKADWSSNGRYAATVRDNQILKQANAFIIFNQPRGKSYEKIAVKLTKKKIPHVCVLN